MAKRKLTRLARIAPLQLGGAIALLVVTVACGDARSSAAGAPTDGSSSSGKSAGKGDETVQTIKGVTHLFDDADVARELAEAVS